MDQEEKLSVSKLYASTAYKKQEEIEKLVAYMFDFLYIEIIDNVEHVAYGYILDNIHNLVTSKTLFSIFVKWSRVLHLLKYDECIDNAVILAEFVRLIILKYNS